MKKIILPAYGGGRPIDICDIVQLVSVGNYTLFYLRCGRQVLSTSTMKRYDEVLEQHHFFRIHRGCTVNLAYLKHYDVDRLGGSIKLKNGLEVPIARRKAKNFIDYLRNSNS